jgi:hypothetical protein
MQVCKSKCAIKIQVQVLQQILHFLQFGQLCHMLGCTPTLPVYLSSAAAYFSRCGVIGETRRKTGHHCDHVGMQRAQPATYSEQCIALLLQIFRCLQAT